MLCNCCGKFIENGGRVVLNAWGTCLGEDLVWCSKECYDKDKEENNGEPVYKNTKGK